MRMGVIKMTRKRIFNHRLTIMVKDDMIEKLNTIAEDDSTTVSELIRAAVGAFIVNKKREKK